MSKNIQAIRGMNDILPQDTGPYRYLEKVLIDILINHGYNEIRLPIIERTSLFKRSVGTVTDVVEKEMYSFCDRNGDSVTLRPEGTASCVRACIEHSLFYRNQDQRLWYVGPMFRRERPQKGRYRQFHQLSAEAFGDYGPAIDAELVIMTARFWKFLGINKHLLLELNSVGSIFSRALYSKELSNFLFRHIDKLDLDSRNRLYSNPIRILDSKDNNVQELLNDAPTLNQYLDTECRFHFKKLCELLDENRILYTINPRLVRGLDYYNRTVFEWVTQAPCLGAQKTICAGGRYDKLVSQLGGRSIPAIGCSVGLERLFLLMNSVNSQYFQNFSSNFLDIYLAIFSESNYKLAILLSGRIREILPRIRLRTSYSPGSFKKHFRRAYEYGARVVLFIDGHDLLKDYILFKDFAFKIQERLIFSCLMERLLFIFKRDDR